MRYRCLLVAATILIGAVATQPAQAILPFYQVFKKEYLEKHPDQKFAAEVDKASNRCFICHQGKVRKNHNAFGKHLEGVLDKKEDAKNVEKISASIKKVLEMHVDPKNDKSETYLDRLKASKWPGGELDELKKEPKESEQHQAK
jgi:hypothetical protein